MKEEGKAEEEAPKFTATMMAEDIGAYVASMLADEDASNDRFNGLVKKCEFWWREAQLENGKQQSFSEEIAVLKEERDTLRESLRYLYLYHIKIEQLSEKCHAHIQELLLDESTKKLLKR
jgi:hypothetical protein